MKFNYRASEFVDFLRSKRAAFALLLPIVATVFVFQNCGPTNSSTMYESSVPSPFADRKTLVAKTDLATGDDGIERLKADVILVAKVSNGCARSWCVRGEHSDAISCQAFAKGPHPKLVDSAQAYEIRGPGPMTEEELEAWARKSPADTACLTGISPLRHYENKAVFSDPEYTQQQAYMALTNFESVATLFPASELSPVKVAVIDSGVGEHPDLTSVDARESFTSSTTALNADKALFENDNVLKPKNNHGTLVAGIIGANPNNGVGMAGIAPNARIHSYGIGNAEGSGMTTIEIANAVSSAIIDHVEVVNLSLGQSNGYYDDPMLRDAFVDGYKSGVFFVVAAGNSNQSLETDPSYPAQYADTLQNVMAVAASDGYGYRAAFSNYGKRFVSLMAPGVGVLSTVPDSLGGGFKKVDGTSFAAPMATGAATLAIGFRKKKGRPVDFDGLRKLISVDGATPRPAAEAWVMNGAFLDFKKLGETLRTEASQTVLSSSMVRLTDASGRPVVQLTISWTEAEAASIPEGGRLGIFDLSSGCNFSAPCLVSSVEWPPRTASCREGSCTYTQKLPREAVVSLMPTKSDPTMALILVTAIYRKVQNPDGTFKNVYAVDASSKSDLRTLSNPNGSPIVGLVENIRMDMQNLYVQGWVCLPGSEIAVPVRLMSGGRELITDYAYDYPYMIPHNPMDGVNSRLKPRSGYPRSVPYMAYGIKTMQRRRSRFLAGLEANPTLVQPCDTLTAAHGFEFVVPLADVSSADLAGKDYSVAAGDGAAFALPDPSGTTSFTFPDTPPTARDARFVVQRTLSSMNAEGSLCSTSPSPIEVEASFTEHAFLWALTDREPTYQRGEGFVHDPSLPVAYGTFLPVRWVASGSNSSVQSGTFLQSLSINGFMWNEVQRLAPHSPNADVYGPYSDPTDGEDAAQEFVTRVNSSYDFRRIGTAEPVELYFSDRSIKAGTGLDPLDMTQMFSWTVTTGSIPAWEQERLSSRLRPWNSQFWDAYDWGEEFSTNLIGYALDNRHERVARYLASAYQVKGALREVKKYETPLNGHSTVLGSGHLAVNWSGRCGDQYEHTGAVSADSFSDMSIYASLYRRGFALRGQGLSAVLRRTAKEAMLRLPITLRFFQDGRLILHLESDTGSNFHVVSYSFH